MRREARPLSSSVRLALRLEGLEVKEQKTKTRAASVSYEDSGTRDLGMSQKGGVPGGPRSPGHSRWGARHLELEAREPQAAGEERGPGHPRAELTPERKPRRGGGGLQGSERPARPSAACGTPAKRNTDSVGWTDSISAVPLFVGNTVRAQGPGREGSGAGRAAGLLN